jgi:cysteine desulfurase
MSHYFNHNSTSPIRLEAIKAWEEAARLYWQNPSALDAASVAAHTKLEEAREQVAQWCGAQPERIVFTSGATENAHSVFAYWSRIAAPHQVVGVSVLEHPCVFKAAQHYFKDRVVPLKVNREGIIDKDALRQTLLENDCVGVAVLAASHLMGVLQPIPEVLEVCCQQSVSLFVDAAQWAGRLPMEPLWGANFLGISSHKLGGPRGVGALKVPLGLGAPLMFHGGHQQNDLRAGTEDVPGILAFVAAWQTTFQLQPLFDRKKVIQVLQERMPNAVVLGHPEQVLWNTIGIVVSHGANTRWLKRLEKRGFIVGQGSACGSNPQDVLLSDSLGVPVEIWQRFLRLSAGYETTFEDWMALIEALAEVSEELEVVQDQCIVV